MNSRHSIIHRKTSETDIYLELNLDAPVLGKIKTQSGFLDHMLDVFSKHSGIGLAITCKGDTHIDLHHSIEDVAICLGQALAECLQNKKGIERYGFYYVTMDEALARVCLDLCNRIAFHYSVSVQQAKIGNLETEMIAHFFESLCQNAKINLHIDLIHGINAHHCFEAVFKAFARALAMAVSPSLRIKEIPSSKGIL